jgi:carbon-monoxide dehydrogenase large subunit
VDVDGAYTNKPPGGIAYRCSFRVTEVHTIERMADIMAHQLGIDPAEFRMKNFVKPEQFPYRSALGWEYDSGDYAGALRLAMDRIGYATSGASRRQARARRADGIGISSFTEIVGAGPSKHFDILGIKMFDSCEIRIHRTGKAIARFGTKSQGQGMRRRMPRSWRRSWGFPPRTSRSRRAIPTPRPASARMRAGRRRWRGRPPRGRAQDPGQGAEDRRVPARVRARGPRLGAGQVLRQGRAGSSQDIQEIAFAAYTNHPQGWRPARGGELLRSAEPHLPFGSHICVVDIDKGTGEVKIRRFVAIDDCGTSSIR